MTTMRCYIGLEIHGQALSEPMVKLANILVLTWQPASVDISPVLVCQTGSFHAKVWGPLMLMCHKE